MFIIVIFLIRTYLRIGTNSVSQLECKETNQFAAIQCRGLFNCTGVLSILYTVDCTHILEQPGMNIFSYVLVQG